MHVPAFEDVIVNLQSIGLLYDVFGILILGIPIVFRSADRIHEQAGTYWDLSSPVVKSLSSQTWDTFIGSVLLFLGFVFQLAGTFGYRAPTNCGLTLVCLLAFTVALYWIWLRRVLVKSLTSRVHEKWEKTKLERADQDVI